MKSSEFATSIPNFSWDVVVIGAGAAGLMSALEISSKLNVLLINRNTSKRSSSRWAQGGIAAVTRSEDSLQSHASDTIKAGNGLCDGNAVRMFVQESPKSVERLINLGMEFDKKRGEFATTLEAAHSHRRVLHVQDRTGRALVDVLTDQVDHSKNIFHLRGIRVTQLWVKNGRCCGVQILDGPCLRWIESRAVVLATGGGGHLFANTTNPAQACGEGIALAWKAGAVLEDLEFVQFHPTALKLHGAPCFLISEALRGEGAFLVDPQGNSPVENLSGKDLAPRDQVSRALFKAMATQKLNHMCLDMRSIPSDQVQSHFPNILHRCKEFGLDPLKNLIPVAPAAHYWMGGVATDLTAKTTLQGLYAVGEVACTGLHGANRLASNSLMECLVFSRKMSLIELSDNFINSDNAFTVENQQCSLRYEGKGGSKYLVDEIENLRKICWRYVGVDRSAREMHLALRTITKNYNSLLQQPLINLIENQNQDISYSLDEYSRRDLNLLLDLNHRQLTTILMLRSCLFRKESRGGHFRKDYPISLPFWQCHTRQKIGENIYTRPVNL